MSAKGLLRMQEAAERVADSAIPVYRQGKGGTPEGIGSAVFLEIAGRKFLATAAHVLDAGEDRNIYLPRGDTLRVFGPVPVHISQAPASGRRDDKFDFAVVELIDENAERFAKRRFITLAEIDQDEVPRDGRTYTFVGYPASRNKSKRGTTDVQEHLVHYSGRPLPQERYEKEGLNLAAHLIIEFNVKRMMEAGEEVQPISPKGISGGAVWRIGDPPGFEDGSNKEGFVGIGMEYRADALIAVRISVILEAMRSFFPELDWAIPRSKWIGLDVTVQDRRRPN